MKNKQFLLRNIFVLICFFLVHNGYSQNISGKITYKFSMKPISEKMIDSINKKNASQNAKMNDFTKSVFKNVKDVNGFLDFKNEESLYYAEDEMKIDDGKLFNLNRIFAGDDHKYYKNIKTKEQYHESSVFGELELIEYDNRKWQITQESKKIGNYLCFKAIDLSNPNQKVKAIAWFTPEIPVNFGPLNFNGLPGLILEIENGKTIIIATKIELNPQIEIKIIKPTKGKRITAEESRKRAEGFWKSIDKQKSKQ